MPDRYPDTHPAIRDHVVTVTTPSGSSQYVPRDVLESALDERDEFRKVIALISAWRVTSGTRDAHLDALLERAGETYDSARAMAGLIGWARSVETEPEGSQA